MSDSLLLPVILGTVRDGRMSARVARFVHRHLSGRAGVRTMLIDPDDIPWFGNLRHREWEFPTPPDGLAELTRTLAEADGFVLVTPEYNHGYPGALKNFLDTWYDEWNRKPFGIVTVSNGHFGGVRAATALRPVIGAIQGVPIPTSVPVPKVSEAFEEDGTPAEPAVWEKRIGRLADELETYAKAMRALRVPTPG